MQGTRLATLCLLAAALCAAAHPATALAVDGAPASVTVSVQPDTATIGDHLHYVLTIDRADGVDVVVPDVVSDLRPFEVLDAILAEPEARDGRVVERRDYIIAVFETGELFVPALEFSYVTADGDSGVAFSDSLPVTIESVLPEVREDQQVGPMDIKPPVELPRRVWPYVVTALALAALAAGLYYLRRWLKRRGAREAEEPVAEEPPVPRIAAHVVALERLDALERDDPIGRGDLPGFYVRVTEIVRLYLRDRFGVDAIDMTTTELVPAMREARIEEAEIEWGRRYMTHADLAKFAKHVPAEERARADLGEAREFVERTRLRGEEASGGLAEDRTAGGGEAEERPERPADEGVAEELPSDDESGEVTP